MQRGGWGRFNNYNNDDYYNYNTEEPNLEKAKERLNECIQGGSKLLNFDGCNLSSFDGLDLGMLDQVLSKVEVLHLSRNRFESLPDLDELAPQLKLLDCGFNTIAKIDTLPPTLRVFKANHNPLNNAPDLAAMTPRLETLDLTYCNLTKLPELPPRLQHLIVAGNGLKKLPELPSTLIAIDISINQFTSLPSLKKTTIERVYFGYNRLTKLPELPNTLTYLSAEYNFLTEVPVLPSLQVLDIRHNKIEELSELSSSLETLNVSMNHIKELPSLPRGLQRAFLEENNLTKLPELPPGLKDLFCKKNRIRVLPHLPETLEFLSVDVALLDPPFNQYLRSYNLRVAIQKINEYIDKKQQLVELKTLGKLLNSPRGTSYLSQFPSGPNAEIAAFLRKANTHANTKRGIRKKGFNAQLAHATKNVRNLMGGRTLKKKRL